MYDNCLFAHARDESRRCYRRLKARLEYAGDTSDLLAEFELHGGTLRQLVRWEPHNAEFRQALLDWELLNLGLKFLLND
ncbi:MAG: hypothetical protein JO199_08450 [Candidatus Eremiobacteraeota bacterium]|nr:hypothetical protein [Candidatus Eremiobacteraeota bacterium]